MKKLLGILAAAILAIPFVSVNAATWKTYTPGEEVNFYAYEGDTEGVTTYIVEDKDSADSEYVKTWMTGFAYTTMGTKGYCYVDKELDCKVFANTEAYNSLISKLNENFKGLEGHAKDIKTNMSLISLDEIKTMFKPTASEDGKTYTINVEKYGSVFEKLGKIYDGFFTSTITTGEDGNNYMWIIKLTFDDANKEGRKITGITVVQEAAKSEKDYDFDGTTYAYVPVVSFDKKFDCHYTEIKDVYACYKCDDNLTWKKEGTQDASCTLVETVKVKDKCVNPVKTGVSDYIIPFASVVCVAGVALVITKKKDLFRKF